MSGQQVGAVALVAVASWALAKLGYSLVSAPKESRLTVFVHQIRAPPSSATLLAAAGTGQNDLTRIGFGSFLVFDNEVREGPDKSTLLLGRERGYGPITDLQGEQGIQLTSTMVFNKNATHKGTLTFQGFVGGPELINELMVVGGTEDFRAQKAGIFDAVFLVDAVRPGARFDIDRSFLLARFFKFHLPMSVHILEL